MTRYLDMKTPLCTMPESETASASNWKVIRNGEVRAGKSSLSLRLLAVKRL